TKSPSRIRRSCRSRGSGRRGWFSSTPIRRRRSGKTRRARTRTCSTSLRKKEGRADLFRSAGMEVPLTPLEFARRARRLYASREAVVDGSERFTYERFLERCDRWSSALLALGVRQGERIVYIAPNTHAQLESFYAVPQIGAVLVPVNFRLTPDDFAYIITHSGARVVCAHEEYLDAIDGIRSQIAAVEHFVALGGSRPRWLEYERLVETASPHY